MTQAVHPRVYVSNFIDDAYPDAQFARQLVNDLNAAGAVVANLAGVTDAELMQRLKQVLLNCQWLILVQTPNALYSQRVRMEVNTALELVAQGHMQGVLTILAAPCNPQDVPPTWASLRTFNAHPVYQNAVVGILAEMGMGEPIRPTAYNNNVYNTMPLASGSHSLPTAYAASPPSTMPPINEDQSTVLPHFPAAEDKPTLITAPGRDKSSPNTRLPGGPRGLWSMLRTVLIVLVIAGLAAANLFLLYRLNTTTASLQTNAIAAAVHASMTAQIQATAANALTTLQSPYLPKNGTLELNDALQGNDSKSNWDVNSLCTFNGETYDVSEPSHVGYTYCIDGNTDFTNFTYQVQMKIVKGNAGGIVFRADRTNQTFYYLRIGQDGHYGLYVAVDNVIAHNQALATGTSSFIHSGLNQTNLLAVVVRGRFLDIYVNLHLLANVNNSAFHHGQIGVFTDADASSGAEAVFSYAKVWLMGA